MNEKNTEMLEKLRDFVMNVLNHQENATSAELEAMTEAVKILIKHDYQ